MSDYTGPAQSGSQAGESASGVSGGEKLPAEQRLEENPPAQSSNLSPLAKMRNAELGVDENAKAQEWNQNQEVQTGQPTQNR